MLKNGRNLFAVGNRTHGKAVAFAEKYNIGRVYDSYDEMFTDPDVDIIYITTPHNTHYGFMKKAILNKKHILVEKSITLNSDELGELIALADENNVVIGEAMTVYHMPIYKKLNEILKSGTLGRVNLITMNFGSFSVLSKYVLMFDMLAGRLELFPVLLCLYPSTWKKF